MNTASPSFGSFPSLAALREEHRRLQNELGSESAVLRNLQGVSEFVHRAVSTGASLDDKDDRKSAQAVINYWVSRLGAAFAKSESQEANPFAYQEFDSLLAEFDASTLGPATAMAEKWAQNLSEPDAKLARRALMRMVRLAANHQTVLTPVRRESLDDLEPRERLDQLLAELVSLGVVRRTASLDQGEEYGLRSLELLDKWAFLKSALDQRKELRSKAEAWQAEDKPVSSLRTFLRSMHSSLVAVGLRIDALWGWMIRTVGRKNNKIVDPAVELPDVDYYRDRTQSEIDYLFRRRAKAKEEEDSVRVTKGVIAFSVIGVLAAGFYIYHVQSQATKSILKAETQATQIELTQRRARQRLKEHIALIRQLAQFHQYDGDEPNQSRADVARWRIESPIERGERDQEEYKKELELLGVDFNSNQDSICVACSATPIAVARELRTKLLEPRLDPESKDYDKDTVEYRKGLIRNRYDVALKLTAAIRDHLQEPPERTGAYDYDALAGYMEEFWILYYGEMVVVESPEVEAAMVRFGNALLGVDAAFGQLLADQLAAANAPGERLTILSQSGEVSPKQQPRSLVAKTNTFRPSVESPKFSNAVDQFRQAPLQELTRKFNDSTRKKFVAALNKLNTSCDQLQSELSRGIKLAGGGN